MTTHSRTWQTVKWVLVALVAFVFGAAGLARLAEPPTVALTGTAGAVLLLAGVACSVRARGRGRFLAALDAYATREIDRERRRAAA